MGFHFKFSETDAKYLLMVLLVFEAILAYIYISGIMVDAPKSIRKLFDLDDEETISSWFSSVQLCAIGILFLFSGSWQQAERVSKPAWLLVIGAGLIFLSLDEAAAVHEQITRNFREVEWMPRFNQRHGMWIPVYFAIAIVMTFLCRKTILSVWKAYPKQSRIIAVGATILVLGGVGLEILSYWYLRDAKSSFLFILEVTLEEFFEMAGASIILYGTILCALQTPHDGTKA